MARPLRPLALLLAPLALGCGYRLLHLPAELGSDIEIRALENHSNVPAMQKLINDALYEEFERRGELRPRYSAGPAGTALVLSGVIREVKVRAVAFDTVGLALEDQVALVVDVSITRTTNGEVVWRRSHWTQREKFTTSADHQVYLTNKEQALMRLSSELASKVHDGLFAAF